MCIIVHQYFDLVLLSMLFVYVLKYVIIVSFEQHVQRDCQVAMFTSLQTNKLLVKPTAKQ